MKCRVHFSDRVRAGREVSDKDAVFKLKSTWTPDVVDPALELFLQGLEYRVLSIEKSGRNYSNLNKEERQVLKNLNGYADTCIVIKNADKGSAVVVWGIEEYRNEAYKQLGKS